MITPGYLAILDTPQGQLAFHLDSSGDRYRLAAQGLFPGPDQALIVWERSGGIAGICQRLEIHLDFTYIVSDCFTEETTSSGSLPEDEAAYLSGLIDRFRTFRYTLEPPQGSADMFSDQYNFTGDGAITPSQMEQEQLNEYLAKLANRLANSGPTSASTVIEQALLSSPAWK